MLVSYRGVLDICVLALVGLAIACKIQPHGLCLQPSLRSFLAPVPPSQQVKCHQYYLGPTTHDQLNPEGAE